MELALEGAHGGTVLYNFFKAIIDTSWSKLECFLMLYSTGKYGTGFRRRPTGNGIIKLYLIKIDTSGSKLECFLMLNSLGKFGTGYRRSAWGHGITKLY
jgi:hypothetical protein